MLSTKAAADWSLDFFSYLFLRTGKEMGKKLIPRNLVRGESIKCASQCNQIDYFDLISQFSQTNHLKVLGFFFSNELIIPSEVNLIKQLVVSVLTR